MVEREQIVWVDVVKMSVDTVIDQNLFTQNMNSA